MLSMTILLKFILKLTSVVPCLFFYLKAARTWKMGKKQGMFVSASSAHMQNKLKLFGYGIWNENTMELYVILMWATLDTAHKYIQLTMRLVLRVMHFASAWIIYGMRWCLSFCLHSNLFLSRFPHSIDLELIRDYFVWIFFFTCMEWHALHVVNVTHDAFSYWINLPLFLYANCKFYLNCINL